MKRNFKVAGLVLSVALAATMAYAHQNDTTLSRLLLVFPDLGHEGGSALHTKVGNLVTRVGDNMDSRYQEYTAVANSAVTTHTHNFNIPFSDMVVVLWSGTGSSKTLIADPVAAGWTIAANGGALKTAIDITAPSSGGPHDFSVEVKAGFGSMAVQDANAVAITGGTIAGATITGGSVSGITDLAVTDGGTGASTATNARTNLGLGSIATQDASSVAITGGSITNATVVTPTLDDYVTFNEEAAPGTPAASKVAVYALSDGKLYRKDDTGTQYELGGAGGAGEISVIGNPNDATGWASTGAGVTVATTTTSTDLPLGGVVNTAIKITPVSGTTDYAYYCWTQPDALKNRKLKVSQEQRPLSGYATGDLKLDVYTYATAGCGGAAARLPLSTDVSSVSGIPNATGRFTTTFDADGSDYYGIRYTRVAGTTALNIASVIVGPGIQPQSAIVSEWVPFTPVFVTGLPATTVLTGYKRRVGDSLELEVAFTANGAGTGELEFTIPDSLAIDTTKAGAGTSAQALGSAYFNDAGVAVVPLNVRVGNTSSGLIFAKAVTGAADTIDGPEFGASDNFGFRAVVPIASWAGGGTVWIGENVPAFACYNGTATVFDTNGCLIPTITALNDNTTTDQTITLPGVLPDEFTPVIQVQTAGGDGVWHNVGQEQQYTGLIQMYTGTGANRRNYGIGISRISSSKSSFNVRYGNAGTTPSQTFVASQSYPQTAGDRYRVAFTKKGEAVGFGQVAQNSTGLVKSAGQLLGTNTNDSAASGYVGEYLIQSRLRSANLGVTTATTSNVTATPLTLTAGEWDIDGSVTIVPTNASTSITGFVAGISLTSATLPGADTTSVPTGGEVRSRQNFAAVVPGTSGDITQALPTTRVQISTTTTYYLVVNATFSVSTLSTYGSFWARRVR